MSRSSFDELQEKTCLKISIRSKLVPKEKSCRHWTMKKNYCTENFSKEVKENAFALEGKSCRPK